MPQPEAPTPPISRHPIEIVGLASLSDHPRNYRQHPEDQLAHLCQSIKEQGLYRNVVIARGGTILAGHGVVAAARKLGLTELPVVRLPIEPESRAALKVLTADNEIEHLAEQDDRALTELLKEIGSVDLSDLLGTGFDEAMLANLAMVTRPASEIADFDEAKHWVGMPEMGPARREIQLIVNFETEAEREQFIAQSGVGMMRESGVQGYTGWWPPREKEDLHSLRYETAGSD